MAASRGWKLAPQSVRRFFLITLLTGLLLPSVIGLVVWIVLFNLGIGVVNLAQGAAIVLPFTLFFFLPYLLLGMFTRSVLIKLNTPEKMHSHRKWYIAIGAYTGLTLISIFMLSMILPDFEGIAMVVFMWPLTFPVVLIFEIIGVLAGSVFGWVIWLFFHKS